MKRTALLLTASLFATPAHALEFTNLDTVEHRVLYESAGSRDIITIAPGMTERLMGASNGFVSLLDNNTGKKTKRGGNETVHADGILSGMIGAARTVNIPADSNDVFVIWKDGKINRQQSRRGLRGGM